MCVHEKMNARTISQREVLRHLFPCPSGDFLRCPIKQSGRQCYRCLSLCHHNPVTSEHTDMDRSRTIFPIVPFKDCLRLETVPNTRSSLVFDAQALHNGPTGEIPERGVHHSAHQSRMKRKWDRVFPSRAFPEEIRGVVILQPVGRGNAVFRGYRSKGDRNLNLPCDLFPAGLVSDPSGQWWLPPTKGSNTNFATVWEDPIFHHFAFSIIWGPAKMRNQVESDGEGSTLLRPQAFAL